MTDAIELAALFHTSPFDFLDRAPAAVSYLRDKSRKFFDDLRRDDE